MTNAKRSGSNSWMSSLLWLYFGVCAYALMGHGVFVFQARWASDDQIPELIESSVTNHPASISVSYITDEVARLRQCSAALVLHIIPVGLWLILSFMQMAPQFRRSNINRHKLTGQVMLATRSIMMLAVWVMLLLRGDPTFGTEFSLRNPFTFKAWVVVAGFWWVYCGVQGYRHAAKLSLHRWYMIHFLSIGYSNGTARLIIFAYMLVKYPKRNGDESALETPGMYWIIDVAAWVTLVVHSVGAEMMHHWLATRSHGETALKKQT